MKTRKVMNENCDRLDSCWWWFNDDIILLKELSKTIRHNDETLEAQSFCRILTIVGVTRIDFAIDYILRKQLLITPKKKMSYGNRLKIIWEKTEQLHNTAKDKREQIIKSYIGLREFRHLIVHANTYLIDTDKIEKLKSAELPINMFHCSWKTFDKIQSIIEMMIWNIELILFLNK